MATTALAVARAQNRAIAKGTDPKAATCRAKLQRARSALNRQMDRELRLREGAENLLRATAKGEYGGDGGGLGSGGRTKSKSRKLIRQTVALELSFLESNVRVLADELAELNGSVDVYQYRDDDDDDDGGGDATAAGYRADRYLDGFGHDSMTSGGADQQHAAAGKRRRPRQMPMIAVPLKDTRPIDFGPPLERFIGQHYGVDLSVASDEPEGSFNDDENRGVVRRRTLSLREAIDELTQLRTDTQTPSRDADGVRLLLRYYRQLYYVDRRFFPPSSAVSPTSTAAGPHHQNHHQQPQDNHRRHSKHAATTADTSSPPPAVYFEWYDSFGGPVPSCGQRTVRFEQACVLFNVAAVHTQMGAKHDRRCSAGRGRRGDGAADAGKSAAAPAGGPPETAADGAAAATQCFLRAAGAYRHIGETFANAPARAADLRATGVLYTLMMAQAHECVFEKLHWRLLGSVRHRCRGCRGETGGKDGGRRRPSTLSSEACSRDGDRCGRDAATRRTPTSAAGGSGGGGDGTADGTGHGPPSWTELAREAAHVSRMYADVVHSSCRPNDGAVRGGGGKENEQRNTGSSSPAATSSVLPEVWTSVCRIKDRHYAALAYRYAACAVLPYYRRPAEGSSGDRHRRGRHRGADETDADELLLELTAAGLEVVDDDDDCGGDDALSAAARQQKRCKQIGKLLLEAAAAAHDRAARAQRLCRQLRARADGSSSGGGLLADVLNRERRRTHRLLLLHRRNRRRPHRCADDDFDFGVVDDADDDGDSNDSAYDTIGGRSGGGADDRDDHCCCCCCCCRRRCCTADGGEAPKRAADAPDYHECCSDDEDGADVGAVADHCSGGGSAEQVDDFAGIAGIPGLDVDRGVLIRPRTKFRLTAIAPDFTDTGDGDDDDDDDYDDDDDDDYDGDGDRRRQGRERQASRGTAADREERRADLFAGLGPVAVFSARHRCTRPRWFKMVRGGRRRSAGGGDGNEDDETTAASDPIQLLDRWFGFELRSHGGGGAAGAVPPATVGHVRSNSPAQHAGLKRGDIVVALKRAGGRALDVRWETCRRVAELAVHDYLQRRRHPNSAADGHGAATVQLKAVTPIAATASDGHGASAAAAVDPNKVQYSRRRVAATLPLLPAPPPLTAPQSTATKPQQQQRRQRRQSGSGDGDATAGGTSKINAWLWNPFRRRRRNAVGNKC